MQPSSPLCFALPSSEEQSGKENLHKQLSSEEHALIDNFVFIVFRISMSVQSIKPAKGDRRSSEGRVGLGIIQRR